MYAPKPPHLLATLLAIVASMLAACLWPFNFAPRNKVVWLNDGTGVHFSGLGAIASSDHFPSLSQLSPDHSITVSLDFRPTRLFGNSATYILSFSSDHAPPSIVLATSWNSLIVQLGGQEAAGQEVGRKHKIQKAIAAGDRVIVTIATGTQGTSVFLNNRLALKAKDVPDVSSPLGRLLLGTSPTGTSEWQGDILELTIYGGTLTEDDLQRGQLMSVDELSAAPESAGYHPVIARYLFTEGSGEYVRNSAAARFDLHIPRIFQPLRRSVLAPPAEEIRHLRYYCYDILVNFLGFFPFGFIAAWTLSSLTALPERLLARIVVAAGFSLSLSVEIAQVFLATRSSSLTDLCVNTLGCTVGVVAYHTVAEGTQSAVINPRAPGSRLS